MNAQRVCHYLACFLHTPIRLLRTDGEPLLCLNKEEQPALTPQDTAFYQQLLARVRRDQPSLHVEGEQILYGIVPAGEDVYVAGPCCLRDPASAADFLVKRYGLAPETLRCVPKISIETFSTAVIMLYESLSGREWDTSSLWLGSFCDMDFIQSMSRKCQQVISTYREESLFHNPYGQEQREQDAIRNGDLDALEASFREVYPGKVGTLSASPLRHTKNLAVVLITLASRSAIAGGLLPEIAYSMSDAFIQRTEELTAEGEVVALARQAEIEFCQQVRALAGHSSNPLIARCKDLVFRNMHTHVEIRELAEQLGVNANYLSQLFNREEGVPLKDYIAREKVVYSKHHLVYTDASLDAVAAMLGFASQSHFGRVFKRWTCMSPGQYRSQYRQDLARGQGMDRLQSLL